MHFLYHIHYKSTWTWIDHMVINILCASEMVMTDDQKLQTIDGCKVIAIAHITLWIMWANNQCFKLSIQCFGKTSKVLQCLIYLIFAVYNSISTKRRRTEFNGLKNVTSCTPQNTTKTKWGKMNSLKIKGGVQSIVPQTGKELLLL